MATGEIKHECIRPGCKAGVSTDNAIGTVILNLESRYDLMGSDVAAIAHGEICGNCSVDLAEWWNRGKK